MTFNPASKHPAFAPQQPEDLRNFDIEQQERILAKMQSTALQDWQNAKNDVVARNAAAAAFSEVSRARTQIALSQEMALAAYRR